MAIEHAFVSAKEDDEDATLVRPSNWNADHEGLKAVCKASDETVNNSDTLQNDDDLVIAVGANDVWLIHLLLFTTISATADERPDYAFAVPSGGAVRKMESWGVTDVEEFGDGTAEATISSSTFERSIQMIILYIGGGTAGNLQLQWAQNVATEADTKVKVNSFMVCHQLA